MHSKQWPLILPTLLIGRSIHRIPFRSLIRDHTASQIGVAGANNLLSIHAIGYDKDGLIISVGDQKISRNGFGAAKATELGKIKEGLTFNSFGEVVGDLFTVGKKKLFQRKLMRDKLGRIIKIEEYEEREKEKLELTYDSEGRLEKVGSSRRPIRTYKYDSNGNRIEKREQGDVIRAQYDSQDRLIKYGDTQYRYNHNGDLALKIERHHRHHRDFHSRGCRHFNSGHHHHDHVVQTEYKYDVFGNLQSVKMPNGQKIEYIVDGQNRRIGKKLNGKLVQAFVYQSQLQVAAELDGQGRLLKRFVYGTKANIPDYMISGNKTYRIISDQVGTPRLVVDTATGKILEELEFDEFGMREEGDRPASLPFGFAGGLWDRDTGLVRFGARDYDPEVGRWVSKDPIGFNGGSSNLYNYVNGDPINFIDPSGLKLNFQDSQSERLFYQLRNNADAEARQMLDRLEASQDFVVNVGTNPLTQLVGGGSGYTYKDGSQANIILSSMVLNAPALAAQGLLLHELVHAEQIRTGVSPVNGRLPEGDPVRMQKQHQGLPCP